MPFFPEDFRFATRAPKYRVDLYFLPTKNVSTSRELRIVTWFFFYVVCFEGHLNRSTAIWQNINLVPPPIAITIWSNFRQSVGRLCWVLTDTSLILYWVLTETSLRLYWDCWIFAETLLRLCWDSTETILRLCLEFNETKNWDFTETILRIYWDNWDSTEILLKLNWDTIVIKKETILRINWDCWDKPRKKNYIMHYELAGSPISHLFHQASK